MATLLRLIVAGLLFANGFKAGAAYHTPEAFIAAIDETIHAMHNPGEGFEPGPMM